MAEVDDFAVCLKCIKELAPEDKDITLIIRGIELQMPQVEKAAARCHIIETFRALNELNGRTNYLQDTIKDRLTGVLYEEGNLYDKFQSLAWKLSGVINDKVKYGLINGCHCAGSDG